MIQFKFHNKFLANKFKLTSKNLLLNLKNASFFNYVHENILRKFTEYKY